MLPGKLLETRDDPRQPAIADVHIVLLAALAAEPEPQTGALDIDMSVTKRGQTERPVRFRVFRVADPNERLLEQAHGCGEHLLAWDTGAAEVSLDARPYPGKRLGEVGQPLVLRLVTDRPPTLVIAVLLAPARVPARCLDVPERVRRDPDVVPCRRDRERTYPPQLTFIADRLAARVDVDESTTLPTPANPGLLIARVTKPGLPRGGEPIALDLVAHLSARSTDQAIACSHFARSVARSREVARQ